MKQEVFTIINTLGLHARPAGLIAKESRAFKSKITLMVEATGKKAEAKSLMGILALTAKKDTKVTLIIDGPDEEEAMEKFGAMFKSGFGED